MGEKKPQVENRLKRSDNRQFIIRVCYLDVELPLSESESELLLDSELELTLELELELTLELERALLEL